MKDPSFLSPFHLLLRAGAPVSKGKEKGAGQACWDWSERDQNPTCLKGEPSPVLESGVGFLGVVGGVLYAL